MNRKILIYNLIISTLLLVISSSYKLTELKEKVSDSDGNVYKTIKIGNQIWMAENLRTTKYNDGNSIPKVTDILSWHNLSSPAFSPYNYENSSGVFYNWYAVSTGKLCPVGWHVPSDDEWTTLENYLGGNTIAGGKLKVTGTTNWRSPNTAATNESGFTALPAGPIGSQILGYDGFWWSSTMGDGAALYRGLNYSTGSISRSSIQMRAGFCVRCLKD